MIVTNIEEIQAYFPTSVYSSADSLITLMEETEEIVLVPILGRKLYDKVCEIYDQTVERYGGVTVEYIDKKSLTQEVRLVRLCQLPVIYLSLANSTGILTVNLNEGGGMNQSYTEGFDKADEKSVSRFERDAYFKGRRGIDRLLLFLEEDAQQEKPSFAELWHSSRYFYKQGDLLFTTAVEMNRFLDINESREKFIAMLPDIRYCQDSFLSPEVGEELLDALIGWCNGTVKLEQEEPVIKVWREAVDKLRMALALFVESRRPDKQRRYSDDEASMSLARAKRYLKNHQKEFGEYMVHSPLYVKPEPEENPNMPQEEPFDNNDPDNAIFVFRPTINRHH